MRTAIALLIAAALAYASPAAYAAERSTLFVVSTEMCSFAWLSSQPDQKLFGASGAITFDEHGASLAITIGLSVAVKEEKDHRGTPIWKYTYIFINCGEAPALFYTTPGLPMLATIELWKATKELRSIIRLEPMQGVRLVFEDFRPPILTTHRSIWFVNPNDGSPITRNPFPFWLYEPDPAYPVEHDEKPVRKAGF